MALPILFLSTRMATRSNSRNDDSLGIHQHNDDGLKLLMRMR